MKCAGPECDREGAIRGRYCTGHYQQLRTHDWDEGALTALRVRAPNGQYTLCTFPGCENRRSFSDGLCSPHGRQLRRTGSLGPLKPKGGGHVTVNGYRLIAKPGHPNAYPNGKIPEHRWAMAEHLGRPLLPTEDVHHKNGVRTDNRISNLELWSTSQPRGQRVEDKIAWCLEFLSLYGRVNFESALPEI